MSRSQGCWAEWRNGSGNGGKRELAKRPGKSGAQVLA